MKPPFKIQQGYSPVLNYSLIQLIIVSVGFLVATFIVGMIIVNPQANLKALSFLVMSLDPAVFIRRPWTLITHLFVNINTIPGLFNLISLFFFGKMFADFVGMHRLWPVFLYSGICGAVLAFSSVLIVYGFNPPQHLVIVGAVTPSMALLAAVMIVHPDLRLNTLFVQNVPLKYLGIIFILFGMLIAAISTSKEFSWPSLVAFTGSVGFGILYGYLFKRNKDLATGFIKLVYKIERALGKKPRMKVVYGRALSDDDYNTVKKEKEYTLDELLEKISTKGMKSLSKREKEILDKFSKNQ
jgi:membrane associated rhomboid family serine protease